MPELPLTDRDLELIEVALESAISAVGSPLGGEKEDMTTLAGEYRHALRGIQAMRS